MSKVCPVKESRQADPPPRDVSGPLTDKYKALLFATITEALSRCESNLAGASSPVQSSKTHPRGLLIKQNANRMLKIWLYYLEHFEATLTHRSDSQPASHQPLQGIDALLARVQTTRQKVQVNQGELQLEPEDDEKSLISFLSPEEILMSMMIQSQQNFEDKTLKELYDAILTLKSVSSPNRSKSKHYSALSS
ncbi:hypothetical protein G7Y89_g213 [Cudoniella acicularis]|uniref:Uncharacterized protein n=1 Tax=Cudoniella acicularis TaxID=354080 RepID=A0A8H4WBD9_9HELO|nr:hypothetical protein G7Y89_g213 [Cudoniella acicularis]